MEQKPPTDAIAAANRAHVASLPFADTRDFDDADRGFLAALEPCVVTAADGRVVWDNDSYNFLNNDAPDSVHPSLWRQSQLCAKQGLYEVVPGIYQVRLVDASDQVIASADDGLAAADGSRESYRAAVGGGLPGGFLPLPVKYRLHFGEPMHFTGDKRDKEQLAAFSQEIMAHIAAMREEIEKIS